MCCLPHLVQNQSSASERPTSNGPLHNISRVVLLQISSMTRKPLPAQYIILPPWPVFSFSPFKEAMRGTSSQNAVEPGGSLVALKSCPVKPYTTSRARWQLSCLKSHIRRHIPLVIDTLPHQKWLWCFLQTLLFPLAISRLLLQLGSLTNKTVLHDVHGVLSVCPP